MYLYNFLFYICLSIGIYLFLKAQKQGTGTCIAQCQIKSNRDNKFTMTSNRKKKNNQQIKDKKTQQIATEEMNAQNPTNPDQSQTKKKSCAPVNPWVGQKRSERKNITTNEQAHQSK